MADELTIRAATPDDTDRILALMRVTLGEGPIPRQEDFWRWKHVDTPFGPSPSLLAFSGDRLVGLRVFMRWCWTAGEQTVPAVRAVDTATHPEFQGRGIFSRLTKGLLERVRAEGAAFVFNTPNEKSRPGYLKMGWVSLGRVSLWVRPVARALAAGLWRGGAAEGAPLASPASDLAAEPGLARFCAALPRSERLSTRCTPEYLRWRYGEIPGFDYRAAWMLDGEEGAVAVFRRKDRARVSEMRLCQVLVGRGKKSQRLGVELLRSLFERPRAQIVTAMASSGTPARSLLLRTGFLPAPKAGPIMTVRPLAQPGAAPDPLRRADWDLAIGDLELF